MDPAVCGIGWCLVATGFATAAALACGVGWWHERRGHSAADARLRQYTSHGAMDATQAHELTAKADADASELRTEHQRLRDAEAANRAGQFLGLGEGDVQPTPTPTTAPLSPVGVLKPLAPMLPAVQRIIEVDTALRERLKGDRWLLLVYRLQCQKLRARLQKKIELELSYRLAPPPVTAQTEPPTLRRRLRPGAGAEATAVAGSAGLPTAHGLQTNVVFEAVEPDARPVSIADAPALSPAAVPPGLPVHPTPVLVPTAAAGTSAPASESFRKRAVSDATTQPGAPSPMICPGAPAASVTPVIAPFRTAESLDLKQPLAVPSPIPSVSPASPAMPEATLQPPALPLAPDTVKAVVLLTPQQPRGVVVSDQSRASAAMTARVTAAAADGRTAAYAATAVGTARNSGSPTVPQLVGLEKLPDPPQQQIALAAAQALLGANQPGSPPVSPATGALGAALMPAVSAIVKPDAKSPPPDRTQQLMEEGSQRRTATDDAVKRVAAAVSCERDNYRRQIIALQDEATQLKREHLQREEHSSQERERSEKEAESQRLAVAADFNAAIQKLQSELEKRTSDDDEQHALAQRLQSQLNFSQNQLKQMDEELKRLSPKVEECETRAKAQVEECEARAKAQSSESAVLAVECTAVLRDIEHTDAAAGQLVARIAKADADGHSRLTAVADAWQRKVEVVRDAGHRKRAKSEAALNRVIAHLRAVLRRAVDVLHTHLLQCRATCVQLKAKHLEFTADAHALLAAAVQQIADATRKHEAARHGSATAQMEAALRAAATDLTATRVLHDTAKVKHEIERVQLQTRADRLQRANGDAYSALQRLGVEIASSFEPNREGRTLALDVDKSLRSISARLDRLDARVRQVVATHAKRAERAAAEKQRCEAREQQLQLERNSAKTRADALQRRQNELCNQLRQALGEGTEPFAICNRLRELEKRVAAANNSVTRAVHTVAKVSGKLKAHKSEVTELHKQSLATTANLREELHGCQQNRRDDRRDITFTTALGHNWHELLPEANANGLTRRIDEGVGRIERLQQRVTAAIGHIRSRSRCVPHASRCSAADADDLSSTASVAGSAPPSASTPPPLAPPALERHSSALRVGSAQHALAHPKPLRLPLRTPAPQLAALEAPKAIAAPQPAVPAPGPGPDSTACLLTDHFRECEREQSAAAAAPDAALPPYDPDAALLRPVATGEPAPM